MVAVAQSLGDWAEMVLGSIPVADKIQKMF